MEPVVGGRRDQLVIALDDDGRNPAVDPSRYSILTTLSLPSELTRERFGNFSVRFRVRVTIRLAQVVLRFGCALEQRREIEMANTSLREMWHELRRRGRPAWKKHHAESRTRQPPLHDGVQLGNRSR